MELNKLDEKAPEEYSRNIKSILDLVEGYVDKIARHFLSVEGVEMAPNIRIRQLIGAQSKHDALPLSLSEGLIESILQRIKKLKEEVADSTFFIDETVKIQMQKAFVNGSEFRRKIVANLRKVKTQVGFMPAQNFVQIVLQDAIEENVLAIAKKTAQEIYRQLEQDKASASDPLDEPEVPQRTPPLTLDDINTEVFRILRHQITKGVVESRYAEDIRTLLEFSTIPTAAQRKLFTRVADLVLSVVFSEVRERLLLRVLGPEPPKSV